MTMTTTMTMKETQLLAPETGVQQQLRRGFKQNSIRPMQCSNISKAMTR